MATERNRDAHIAAELNRQMRLRQEGKCVNCRKPRPARNRSYCDNCMAIRRMKARERYANRRKALGAKVRGYRPRNTVVMTHPAPQTLRVELENGGSE